MGTTTAPEPTRPAVDDGVWTAWRRTAAIGLAAAIAADVGLMLVHGELVPPLLVFGVIGLVGIGLLPRTGRTGPVLVGLAALVPLAVGLPFVLPGLPHPDSPVDFLHGVATLTFRPLAVVAVVATLRGAVPRGARPAGVVAAAIAGTAVVVSGVATVATASDEVQADDVRLAATDSVWSSDVQATRGATVAVVNDDPYRHTFTVDGTDLDVELPAGTTRRIQLDLPAGAYTLRCDVPGHEAMLADLNVD